MSEKNNKVIYTAIFSGKDDVKPITRQAGYDYVLFTDDFELTSCDYQVIHCQRHHDDPTRDAKRYKVLAHQVMPGYEYSIWIDGSIAVGAVDLDALLDTYLAEHDMALHGHPIRDCVYSEAETCIRFGKDNPAVISAQMEKYRREGYPENHGLVSAGILFRRHTADIASFNNYWWQEICAHSRRDQLSFNYIAWKHALDFYQVAGHVRNGNVPGFTLTPHRKADYLNWPPMPETAPTA